MLTYLVSQSGLGSLMMTFKRRTPMPSSSFRWLGHGRWAVRRAVPVRWTLTRTRVMRRVTAMTTRETSGNQRGMGHRRDEVMGQSPTMTRTRIWSPSSRQATCAGRNKPVYVCRPIRAFRSLPILKQVNMLPGSYQIACICSAAYSHEIATTTWLSTGV